MATGHGPLLCTATVGLGDGLQNAAKGLLGPERLAASGFLATGAVTGFLAEAWPFLCLDDATGVLAGDSLPTNAAAVLATAWPLPSAGTARLVVDAPLADGPPRSAHLLSAEEED